ncbi:MAG TPA: hypothetical protein VHU13_04095 [Solirubrobacteraceae bacterium]|jgi:trehalose synthase|nr:hypothetical protein [Solirubrobacteraceae bacterium]
MASTAADSLTEVAIQALDAARLESLIGAERMAHYEQIAEQAQRVLAGHSVLNVNSTAAGGGVAEMLQTLLAYVRGAGVDGRWLVIKGDNVCRPPTRTRWRRSPTRCSATRA